jgi:hypothetical protein
MLMQPVADASGPAAAAAAVNRLHEDHKVLIRDLMDWSGASGRGYRANALLAGTDARGMLEILNGVPGIQARGLEGSGVEALSQALRRGDSVLIQANIGKGLPDPWHWLMVQQETATDLILGDPWEGVFIRLPKALAKETIKKTIVAARDETGQERAK